MKTIQHSPDMRLKLANAYVMQIRNEQKKAYAAAFLSFKQGLLEHEPEWKDYKLSYMAAHDLRGRNQTVKGTPMTPKTTPTGEPVGAQIQQRTIGLKGAVESFEMFDPLGNCAAAALFKFDHDLFEVLLWDFNSSVPRRYRDTLGVCKCVMEHFFYAKEKAGFTCATEPTPHAPIA